MQKNDSEFADIFLYERRVLWIALFWKAYVACIKKDYLLYFNQWDWDVYAL